MHQDIELSDSVIRPKGEICIVYFSSGTQNTHRFVKKLGFKSYRLPMNATQDSLLINQDYIIICPTYSGGGQFTSGAVPKPVIKFLNIKTNRDHCKGVIATGNTNFNDTFCLAGPILSKKLNVPMLYQLELAGTKHDVETTQKILNDFWEK